MHWLILSAINVLSISVGSLFQKISMKEDTSDPIASSLIFQFLLAGITLLFVLVKGYQPLPISLLPYFLASGSLYAIGTIAYFKAMKCIEASEVTVLSGAGVIATIVASFLFIHDRMAPLQLLGVALIISAVIMINYSRHTFRMNAGAWHAILGTSTYGLAVVIDSYIIRRYDAASFLPLICLIPGIIILLRYINRVSSFIKAIRHINRNLIIFTVLYAIQAITFYLALESGALVGQVSTIARSSIILTVVLAAIFLKETKHVGKKMLAAFFTTIGILLVT